MLLKKTLDQAKYDLIPFFYPQILLSQQKPKFEKV